MEIKLMNEPVKENKILQYVLFFLIAVIATLTTSYITEHFIEKPKTKVVVLDYGRIFSATVMNFMQHGGGDKASELAANKLIDNTKIILKRYQDNGYIVINKSVILATPPSAEITNEVANELGIKL
jgi:hypothetical protein